MMYRITYNGQEIYGPTLDRAVLNPTLETELNSAGSLEFTLPVTRDDDIWNIIQVFRGEVQVWEGDDCIWFGRPLQIVRDWNNQKRVVCEGALAYFNDSVQPTKEYKLENGVKKTPLYNDEQYAQPTYKMGFFESLIDNHNAQVMVDGQQTGYSSRYIFPGVIDVENELVWRKTDYETTAEALQNMCLDTNGGYFILRKEFDETIHDYKTMIDWRKDAPYGTTQPIVFGENMLDITQDLNGADLCTVLIPSGEDDLDLKQYHTVNPETHSSEYRGCSHNSGEDFIIHDEGYAKYGRILKQKSFDDMTTREDLFNKATDWLNDQNKDETTIEISSADLSYLPKYEDVYGRLRIGQKVTVISGPHDISSERTFIIYRVSMNLDSGIKKITVGTPPKKELTDIIKPSTSSSTRGSSGTGGGGNSDSGGGSGGGGYVYVKDVQVKAPGQTSYKSVVSKKTAKIDLSDLGEGTVKDVLVDGVSVVDEEGDANITLPTVPVQDVQVNGTSVVEDGIARIPTPDDFENKIEHHEKGFINDNPTYGEPTDVIVEMEDEYDIITGGIIGAGFDTPDSFPSDSFLFSASGSSTHGPVTYTDPENPQQTITEQAVTESWSHSFNGYTTSTSGVTTNQVWYDTLIDKNTGNTYSPPAHEHLSTHMITTDFFGTIFNATSDSSSRQIVYIKHTAVPTKLVNVTGIFNVDTKLPEWGTGDSSSPYVIAAWKDHTIKAFIRSIKVYASNDPLNWTLIQTISPKNASKANESVSYPINNSNSYTYFKLVLEGNNGDKFGYWGSFQLVGSTDTTDFDIWYNRENNWIKQHRVKDVRIDDVSIVNQNGVANIDSSDFGTTVVANPSGTATDDLDSIQIGNDIYNIVGGGGSGRTVFLSDFYDTAERVVGRWTDGKPLYQKTVLFTGSLTQDTSWHSVAHGVSNIDKCIDLRGSITNTADGRHYEIGVYRIPDKGITLGVDSTYIYYMNNWINTIGNVEFTFKYTKTTDTAGTGPTPGNLIYLPELYSLEEREVGVWIDGYPLYQRTLQGNSQITTAGDEILIAHDIQNIKNVINFWGGMWSTTGPSYQTNRNQNNLYYSPYQVNDTGTYWKIGSTWAQAQYGANMRYRITVQYTKTTDQPGSGTWTPEGQLAHHYSASEHIVGEWIDGSSVYERTWDFGTSGTLVQSMVWTEVPILINDINPNMFIGCEAIQINSGATVSCTAAPQGSSSSQYVRLMCLRNQNETIRYLTLRYTKT